MKNFEQLNRLLKNTLSPTVEPSDELNRKIINKLKENVNMEKNNIIKPLFNKKVHFALIAAIALLIGSVSVFAAIHFFSPKEVAEHLGDNTLAQAFESKNAIEINKSVVSGGYNITLHGVVSGKDLSDFKSSGQNISPERTYAVVSIAKQDGSKMPDTQDEDYGKVPFFVSPLIKGQKPWQVNIATMNGGYGECVIDGIMYRLVECDGVEMFADRGLYLCVSSTAFYDVKAFKYNEATGEISINVDFQGVNVLFDLPLDKSKADYEKADKYLKDMFKEAGAESKTDKKAAETQKNLTAASAANAELKATK